MFLAFFVDFRELDTASVYLDAPVRADHGAAAVFTLVPVAVMLADACAAAKFTVASLAVVLALGPFPRFLPVDALLEAQA